MSLVSPFPFTASPALCAMGFSVLLVLSLVAVEEVELRRTATRAPDAD